MTRRNWIIHPNENFYILAGNTGNNVGVSRFWAAERQQPSDQVLGSAVCHRRHDGQRARNQSGG